jgi:hypothetical protein
MKRTYHHSSSLHTILSSYNPVYHSCSMYSCTVYPSVLRVMSLTVGPGMQEANNLLVPFNDMSPNHSITIIFRLLSTNHHRPVTTVRSIGTRNKYVYPASQNNPKLFDKFDKFIHLQIVDRLTGRTIRRFKLGFLH